jgi:lipoic acid synthetase
MTVQRRLPEWIRVRLPSGETFFETRRVVKEQGLHTVCEEARCPNMSECWSHRTATFMLLGDTCTRNCRFCSVKHGRPEPPDPTEPERVAAAVARLGLQHVVVTSVDRDDLADGGAGHFRQTAEAIRRALPGCAIEVLVPDFRPDSAAIDIVVDAPIDVLNHNVETVPRLYKRVRPGATYERSLALLRRAKERRSDLRTKTGLMLGLGESREEIEATLRDIAAVGCDIVTLGQYLRPTATQLPVERFLPPAEFAEIGAAAREMGFRHVESGPLVRSSYHAWSHVS